MDRGPSLALQATAQYFVQYSQCWACEGNELTILKTLPHISFAIKENQSNNFF